MLEFLLGIVIMGIGIKLSILFGKAVVKYFNE